MERYNQDFEEQEFLRKACQQANDDERAGRIILVYGVGAIVLALLTLLGWGVYEYYR